MDALKKLPLTVKLTVNVLILSILSILVMGWLNYYKAHDLLEENAIELMDAQMENIRDKFDKAYEEVKRDLRYLSQEPSLKEIVDLSLLQLDDARLGNAKKRLERLFYMMCQSKGYLQIRFLQFDNGGQELVRVDGPNHYSGSSTIIDHKNLQKKGDEFYMKNAKTLRPGEARVSKMTLNREHGIVQYPLQATQRVMYKVYSDHLDQNAFGVIVINLNGDLLLQNLQHLKQMGIDLIGFDGQYLFSTRGKEVWSNELGKGDHFSEDEPEVWKALKSGDLSFLRSDLHSEIHYCGEIKYGLGESDVMYLVLTVSEGLIFSKIVKLEAWFIFYFVILMLVTSLEFRF